jgi:hypothetical protein
MKLNFVMTLISLGIASLAAYGFYAMNGGELYVLLLTISSGVALFVTLTGWLGISFTGHGSTVNIRVVSGIFTVLFIISNLIFSFTRIIRAPYIIVNGILLLIYILIVYSLVKTFKE